MIRNSNVNKQLANQGTFARRASVPKQVAKQERVECESIPGKPAGALERNYAKTYYRRKLEIK